MKQIYFTHANDPSVFRRGRKAVTKWCTATIAALFPATTTKLAERVLCMTSRSKRELLPLPFSTEEIDVLGYKVLIYRAGNFDRSVVFVHGWSGSSADFNAFYQPILDRGYNVVTFDHVAHGKSTGTVSNLFVFVRTLEQVLAKQSRQDSIAGIVGHSMGGSAVINIACGEYSSIPTVLIAPVIPLFEMLYESVDRFGISTRWLDHVLAELEQRYGRQLGDIDPTQVVHRLKNPVLVIQDRNDRHIKLETNKKYFSDHLITNLRETEGLGHFKILGAPNVVNDSLGFLASSAGL
jgi:pimeloyl-ACP methyl ester carboxylesterase